MIIDRDDGAVALIATVCGEVAELNYDGAIRAISVSVVREDGSVRSLHAYGEGTRLLLLAGTSLLVHDLNGLITGTRAPRDDLA